MSDPSSTAADASHTSPVWVESMGGPLTVIPVSGLAAWCGCTETGVMVGNATAPATTTGPARWTIWPPSPRQTYSGLASMLLRSPFDRTRYLWETPGESPAAARPSDPGANDWRIHAKRRLV